MLVVGLSWVAVMARDKNKVENHCLTALLFLVKG